MHELKGIRDIQGSFERHFAGIELNSVEISTNNHFLNIFIVGHNALNRNSSGLSFFNRGIRGKRGQLNSIFRRLFAVFARKSLNLLRLIQ